MTQTLATTAPADESAAAVLEAVEALVPTLESRADEAEQLRRLPESSVKDLVATGVLRMLQPKRYGGMEADPGYFYRSLLAIAEACGSTGWVTGVVGVHAWQLALFDDRLQQELWADDPDTLVSSSYMPGGKLTKVDGGYEVTGRWSFSSGSDHCQWAILGAMYTDGDGPPAMFNVVVPRSDYVVEDTWHTVGLRGTGSNDVVIENAFVPSYRMLTRDEVYGGAAPGLELNTAPLYKMPFATMFTNVITTPIIGMAQSMLTKNIEFISGRVSRAHGKVVDNDPYTVAAIGGASREIDACRMQLLANLGDMYELVMTGEAVPMELRTRARRDQVLGTERCVAAIDELFDRGGASVINTSNPMQRIWRDAHAAKHHTVNTNERTLFSWAHHAMGLGTTDNIV